MIRLTDLDNLAVALAQVREMLGLSRYAVSVKIANATGRSWRGVNSQLYEWENGRRSPNAKKLKPYLNALEFDLALVPKATDVRTWPRLDLPSADVQKVAVHSGKVFTRMDPTGMHWAGQGWENGVGWVQLLRWGPVTEIKEENP